MMRLPVIAVVYRWHLLFRLWS